MPTYRCEFEITGDLVLASNVGRLELDGSSGITTFRNGSANDEGHTVDMVASVIGSAESIDTAENELRGVLAEQLDLLTFTTHSRFKIERPIRAFEWEAHQEKRQFRAFHTVDSRHPPEPEFSSDFVATAKVLDNSNPPPFTRTALKYFRYGLLDPQPEDQFMRLWLALEIIAENLKDKEKVPIVCPVCGEALTCAACGVEPMRVPMAKQAIEGLISRIAGEHAKEVSKRQFKARNGLMHGRSVESIEKECKASIEKIVNELGTLAWHAIMSTIPLGDGPELHFGHRDGQFTNLTLVAAMLGEFKHQGDEPHPTDDKLPSVNIDLMTRFGSPDDDN